MLNQKYGVINQMLGWVGIDAINFIGEPTDTFIAVILWDIWQWTPFVALVLLAGLSTVPPEIEGRRPRPDRTGPMLPPCCSPFLIPSLVAVLILRTAGHAEAVRHALYHDRGGTARPPSSSRC